MCIDCAGIFANTSRQAFPDVLEMHIMCISKMPYMCKNNCADTLDWYAMNIYF